MPSKIIPGYQPQGKRILTKFKAAIDVTYINDRFRAGYRLKIFSRMAKVDGGSEANNKLRKRKTYRTGT